MDAKMVCENKRGGHAALQNFRFVDQTDRSQEGVSAYQAVVRSHVMTEVRRQKRFKVKLEKEAGGKVTALASEGGGKSFYKSGQGAYHASPSRPGWASSQDPPSTFNHSMEADSRFAEPFPTQLMNSFTWEPATVSGDENRDFRYASELQELQSTSSWPSDIPSTVLETHLLKLDLKWTSSEAREFDSDSRKHVLMHDSRSDQTGEALPNRNRAMIASPDILGRSRVDPFRALPIPANRDVYQLVDHYNVIIPFLMYGTRSRKPVQHQLYNVATEDPAAFHAMLAYSARQFDSIAGSQPSKRALGHTSRTLRLVYERIREPSFDCDNGLVMAVALLALAERRFGDDAIAQHHWLALRDILNSRAGMEVLRINRWLAAMLYWNCLVWSGTFNRSTATMWPSLIASNDPATGPSASAEFTSFFANLAGAKSRMLDHVRSSCNSPCLYSCSRRRTVFEPTGPLYKIVATTRFRGEADGKLTKAATVHRTSSACQLPCLLYLNIVVMEYEARPELLEYYLGKLMVCVFEDSLDMDVSAEHLLIRLLIGLEDSTAELTRRAHRTIRLASVIQKLEMNSRQRIHNTLLEALVFPEVDFESGRSDDQLFSITELLR